MKLTFLGDIMVQNAQRKAYETQDGYDFVTPLKDIEKNFESSDYIVANLETPICECREGGTEKSFSFSNPIELVEALSQVGVNVLATANNHCLDCGISGLVETKQNIDRIGCLSVGTHYKKEPSFVMLQCEDIKVGVLSFTYGTNAFHNKEYLKEEWMVDLLQDQELKNKVIRNIHFSNKFIVRCIRKGFSILKLFDFNKPVYERESFSKKKLDYYIHTINECRKAGADYIISYLHIGGQYNSQPTTYTKKMCKLSIDSGVDAVIANHEHVIHGLDKSLFKNNKFCVYSLGNFLSGTAVLEPPFDKGSEYSIVVNIELKKSEETIKATYSFNIFINVLENGIVKSKLLYDYIDEQKDALRKKKLILDNDYIVRKVLGITTKSIPLRKEYSFSGGE